MADTEQQTIENIGYRIDTIEVLSYVFDETDMLTENPEPSRIGFLTSVKFNIASDLTKVYVTTDITAVIEFQSKKDDPRPICNLTIRMGFGVIGLDTLIKDQKLIFPEQFSHSLIGASLGTARGIWYAKNFGTKISNLILPLIDGTKLLPGGSFDISDEASKEIILGVPAPELEAA